MPTHYEYALFSLEIYRNLGDNLLLPTGRIPEGWRSYMDSPAELNTNGYFGGAYINDDNSTIVIAHRGTDDGYDLANDATLAIISAISQFSNSAVPFINLVQNKLTLDALSPQITYTGHSLGAALAELSSAYDNVAAITFDSPGIAPVISDMVTAGQLPPDALINANNNVITYNAAPNLVNTLNPHVGKLYRVYPPYDVSTIDSLPDPASPAAYSLFTLNNQHKMGGILRQFNPNTGYPAISS